MTEGLPPAPPTDRLYWTQPQGRTFTAAVTAVRGQKVALDRTLFYPEGGGQPCDTGALSWESDQTTVQSIGQTDADTAVTDVQKEGQTIWHTLAGAVPPVGAMVRGALDWTRRYRHSQRHSAEHLLAQAFWRVNPAFGVRSVSMRNPECTLDLAGQPGASHVAAAQALLQEALREGLSLETPMVAAADLGAYPLRRPPQVEGEVRVVLFRDAAGEVWEASACGGTHLSSGVQAAPVVILRTERVKGDLTRVTFMAGEEATQRLSEVYGQAQTLARGFSVGVERLPERVEDLRAELNSTEARLGAVRRELAGHLLDQAEWRDLPGGQFAFIQLSAQAGTLPAAEEAELLPLLLGLAGQRPASLTVALTSGGDCGAASSLPGHPANTLLKGWLAQSGGRGGGRPELARGQAGQGDRFAQAVYGWLDALPWPE